MPIREYACLQEQCRLHGYRRERFEHTTPPPKPACVECGAEMTEMASRFAATFTGKMDARYNDPKKEYAHREGFWAYEKKNPTGPKWTYIDNWQQRRDWMKQEGLEEGGPAEAGSDGKSVSTSGLPGVWI